MKPMYAKIIKGKKRKTAAVLDLVELQNKEFLITRLFVPEEHRRKGIGTSLLKDVTKDADKECTTLKIEPMPYGEITDEKRKELIAYYKKFDFKYISEKEYMVRNPKCTKNKKL